MPILSGSNIYGQFLSVRLLNNALSMAKVAKCQDTMIVNGEYSKIWMEVVTTDSKASQTRYTACMGNGVCWLHKKTHTETE
jgi:hypothetical protein